ncbi:MAG: hypothetical protein ACXU8U_12710 [Asticcacaulis sp.]
MPRISGTNAEDGAATTGRAYELAVTPNEREDDDTSVIGNRNAGRDAYVAGQFGPDSEQSDGREKRENGDVVNAGGLQPTYEVVDRDNERRLGHQNDRHDDSADYAEDRRREQARGEDRDSVRRDPSR